MLQGLYERTRICTIVLFMKKSLVAKSEHLHTMTFKSFNSILFHVESIKKLSVSF